MPAKTAHFSPKLFSFLRDLKSNNDRDWFKANQGRYEEQVRGPALQFITDFQGPLERISRHFLAIPKKVGGSMFRIHRDVRFSKDKSPYKTAVGIHFRHEAAKDAHAPGYYLHLAPGECFAAAGIWHPPSDALKQLREGIVDDPKGWTKARDAKRFRTTFDLHGDSLKRPPKGFPKDHPLLDDLKRKDFVGVCNVTQKRVTSAGFLKEFSDLCKAATPFMRFLCEALEVDF